MSHYFLNNGFDFVSNDGNFGFYIDQSDLRTSSNTSVAEEYVIEVHYLGDAVTSLNLDVTNINHAGSLNDLYYVEKGFIGLNMIQTTDGHRYGEDGKISYSINPDIASSLTSEIIAGGSSPADTYWNVQQGGLDPIYGLIEIKIPNTGPTLSNGYRDHDYLYLETQLYFDVIQQKQSTVDSLQDLIDGNINLVDFALELSTATSSFETDIFITEDASNDIDGGTINSIPHMIYFDNVNYYGYDDFTMPVQLNTGDIIDTLSETSLIGEFRIDENADGVWSFDAEMQVWLNTEDRSGEYKEVLIPASSDSFMDPSDSYMDPSDSFMDPSDSYMDPSDSFMDPSDSFMDPSDSFMDPSDSYMDPSDSFMDPSDSFMDPSDSYMDPSDSYMNPSDSYMDLNEKFINTSGVRENEASFKLSISRDVDGMLTITDLDDGTNTITEGFIIDTMPDNSTYQHSGGMIGDKHLDVGLYKVDYHPDGGPGGTGVVYMDQLVSEYTVGSDDVYSINRASSKMFSEDSELDNYNALVDGINDGTYKIDSPVTMLFDDLSASPFTISITDPALSISYDLDGVPSAEKLGIGDYLVNVSGPSDIKFTQIGPDTDFDGKNELLTDVYDLYIDITTEHNELSLLKFLINDKSITSTTLTYEGADEVILKMDELGDTWNSANIDSSYMDVDGNHITAGTYKVSLNSGHIYLQATTGPNNDEYDIDKSIAPYQLGSDSQSAFEMAINMGSGGPAAMHEDLTYKQYFYDLLDPETHDGAEVISYMAEHVDVMGGTSYVEGQTFDNNGINSINTADVTSITSIDAGAEDDIIVGGSGGAGGFEIDGGAGFDMYLTTPASIKITKDQNENITAEDGVLIDLNAGFVTYYDSGVFDKVENIEYFMGTLGDDQFVGGMRYSINAGYNDASHQNYLQAFNPTKGKDEIFGAVTDFDKSGNEIDVFTVVDYDGMQGGQGVIFILDGSEAATYAAEGDNEISYNDISDFAGEYWNATSWAGDGWLPSNDDILNDSGNFSTVSRYEPDKQGATLILDSFGDTDLAFDVDHYIGSGDADIFFGSAGNDSFDAATGTGNFMSGGDGLDELKITDLNELVRLEDGTIQDAGDSLDLDSIIIERLYDYTYSNYQDVDIDLTSGTGSQGKLVTDSDNDHSGAPLYRIDFAEVNNLSEFFKDNAVAELYSVSSEYALFIRTNMDLSDSANLPGSGFTFDNANLKIDVTGKDISVLDSLSGQLVLAEESAVIEGYIVQGNENDGNLYSTVIEDVEKVSLTSDDVNYFGTGGEISGSQEDIYQLITGGQGDLGEMLYVTTGETLNSTTGVGEYSAGSNFLNGEIFYSGHHTDFDRNTTNPSSWANSVASAFLVEGQATAKIWNNEIAQFFVWYDADTTDNIDGYEIAVRYQNGNINAWGIDNRQFDTFQNVTVDQSIADAINLQFGDSVAVELGEYRILYEAAYTDIETLISSHEDVTQWDFGFQPNSSRSTFYIQVGGDATGENGSSGIDDTQVTNVKVERVGDTWVVDPQAEILVNLPVLPGADENDNLMISGDAAETIEGGRGSDVMMGRGGSDNYKISAGDTLSAEGSEVFGSFGVAGDVINEIGGSSDDKSDSITLSSASDIDQLTFSRTEIANEYWGNTLKIDVDYNKDDNVDDTIYVFDQFNQNLASRQVEQLFLDDGWDTDEIWNLIVGDEIAGGTRGQDILMAGYGTTALRGGNGKDIMIGDDNGNATSFELGRKTGEWDQVADVIQNFGSEDQIDLSHLGITANDLSANGTELVGQIDGNSVTLASISFTDDSMSVEDLVAQMQAELQVV